MVGINVSDVQQNELVAAPKKFITYLNNVFKGGVDDDAMKLMASKKNINWPVVFKTGGSLLKLADNLNTLGFAVYVDKSSKIYLTKADTAQGKLVQKFNDKTANYAGSYFFSYEQFSKAGVIVEPSAEKLYKRFDGLSIRAWNKVSQINNEKWTEIFNSSKTEGKIDKNKLLLELKQNGLSILKGSKLTYLVTDEDISLNGQLINNLKYQGEAFLLKKPAVSAVVDTNLRRVAEKSDTSFDETLNFDDDKFFSIAFTDVADVNIDIYADKIAEILNNHYKLSSSVTAQEVKQTMNQILLEKPTINLSDLAFLVTQKNGQTTVGKIAIVLKESATFDVDALDKPESIVRASAVFSFSGLNDMNSLILANNDTVDFNDYLFDRLSLLFSGKVSNVIVVHKNVSKTSVLRVNAKEKVNVSKGNFNEDIYFLKLVASFYNISSGKTFGTAEYIEDISKKLILVGAIKEMSGGKLSNLSLYTYDSEAISNKINSMTNLVKNFPVKKAKIKQGLYLSLQQTPDEGLYSFATSKANIFRLIKDEPQKEQVFNRLNDYLNGKYELFFSEGKLKKQEHVFPSIDLSSLSISSKRVIDADNIDIKVLQLLKQILLEDADPLFVGQQRSYDFVVDYLKGSNGEVDSGSFEMVFNTYSQNTIQFNKKNGEYSIRDNKGAEYVYSDKYLADVGISEIKIFKERVKDFRNGTVLYSLENGQIIKRRKDSESPVALDKTDTELLYKFMTSMYSNLGVITKDTSKEIINYAIAGIDGKLDFTDFSQLINTFASTALYENEDGIQVVKQDVWKYIDDNYSFASITMRQNFDAILDKTTIWDGSKEVLLTEEQKQKAQVGFEKIYLGLMQVDQDRNSGENYDPTLAFIYKMFTLTDFEGLKGNSEGLTIDVNKENIDGSTTAILNRTQLIQQLTKKLTERLVRLDQEGIASIPELSVLFTSDKGMSLTQEELRKLVDKILADNNIKYSIDKVSVKTFGKTIASVTYSYTLVPGKYNKTLNLIDSKRMMKSDSLGSSLIEEVLLIDQNSNKILTMSFSKLFSLWKKAGIDNKENQYTKYIEYFLTDVSDNLAYDLSLDDLTNVPAGKLAEIITLMDVPVKLVSKGISTDEYDLWTGLEGKLESNPVLEAIESNKATYDVNTGTFKFDAGINFSSEVLAEAKADLSKWIEATMPSSSTGSINLSKEGKLVDQIAGAQVLRYALASIKASIYAEEGTNVSSKSFANIDNIHHSVTSEVIDKDFLGELLKKYGNVLDKESAQAIKNIILIGKSINGIKELYSLAKAENIPENQKNDYVSLLKVFHLIHFQILSESYLVNNEGEFASNFLNYNLGVQANKNLDLIGVEQLEAILENEMFSKEISDKFEHIVKQDHIFRKYLNIGQGDDAWKKLFKAVIKIVKSRDSDQIKAWNIGSIAVGESIEETALKMILRSVAGEKLSKIFEDGAVSDLKDLFKGDDNPLVCVENVTFNLWINNSPIGKINAEALTKLREKALEDLNFKNKNSKLRKAGIDASVINELHGLSIESLAVGYKHNSGDRDDRKDEVASIIRALMIVLDADAGSKKMGTKNPTSSLHSVALAKLTADYVRDYNANNDGEDYKSFLDMPKYLQKELDLSNVNLSLGAGSTESTINAATLTKYLEKPEGDNVVDSEGFGISKFFGLDSDESRYFLIDDESKDFGSGVLEVIKEFGRLIYDLPEVAGMLYVGAKEGVQGINNRVQGHYKTEAERLAIAYRFKQTMEQMGKAAGEIFDLMTAEAKKKFLEGKTEEAYGQMFVQIYFTLLLALLIKTGVGHAGYRFVHKGHEYLLDGHRWIKGKKVTSDDLNARGAKYLVMPDGELLKTNPTAYKSLIKQKILDIQLEVGRQRLIDKFGYQEVRKMDTEVLKKQALAIGRLEVYQVRGKYRRTLGFSLRHRKFGAGKRPVESELLSSIHNELNTKGAKTSFLRRGLGHIHRNVPGLKNSMTALGNNKKVIYDPYASKLEPVMPQTKAEKKAFYAKLGAKSSIEFLFGQFADAFNIRPQLTDVTYLGIQQPKNMPVFNVDPEKESVVTIYQGKTKLGGAKFYEDSEANRYRELIDLDGKKVYVDINRGLVLTAKQGEKLKESTVEYDNAKIVMDSFARLSTADVIDNVDHKPRIKMTFKTDGVGSTIERDTDIQRLIFSKGNKIEAYLYQPEKGSYTQPVVELRIPESFLKDTEKLDEALKDKFEELKTLTPKAPEYQNKVKTLSIDDMKLRLFGASDDSIRHGDDGDPIKVMSGEDAVKEITTKRTELSDALKDFRGPGSRKLKESFMSIISGFDTVTHAELLTVIGRFDSLDIHEAGKKVDMNALDQKVYKEFAKLELERMLPKLSGAISGENFDKLVVELEGFDYKAIIEESSKTGRAFGEIVKEKLILTLVDIDQRGLGNNSNSRDVQLIKTLSDIGGSKFDITIQTIKQEVNGKEVKRNYLILDIQADTNYKGVELKEGQQLIISPDGKLYMPSVDANVSHIERSLLDKFKKSNFKKILENISSEKVSQGISFDLSDLKALSNRINLMFKASLSTEIAKLEVQAEVLVNKHEAELVMMPDEKLKELHLEYQKKVTGYTDEIMSGMRSWDDPDYKAVQGKALALFRESLRRAEGGGRGVDGFFKSFGKKSFLQEYPHIKNNLIKNGYLIEKDGNIKFANTEDKSIQKMIDHISRFYGKNFMDTVNGFRLNNLQILGSMKLFDGRGAVINQLCGEGKTGVVAAAAYVLSLAGRGAHVSSANIDLAAKDLNAMKKAFVLLTDNNDYAAFLDPNASDTDKKVALDSFVTFSDLNTFMYTYEKSVSGINILPRPFHAMIGDEIDQTAMIDDAVERIISGAKEDKSNTSAKNFFYGVDIVAQELLREFKADENNVFSRNNEFKLVTLTLSSHQIIDKMKKVLSKGHLKRNPEAKYLLKLIDKSIETSDQGVLDLINLHLAKALEVRIYYKEKIKFLVGEGNNAGKVGLVNESSDQVDWDRKLQKNLHQALEAMVYHGRGVDEGIETGHVIAANKNIDFSPVTKTDMYIGVRDFFRIYNIFSGSSGTADQFAAEFYSRLGLQVTSIRRANRDRLDMEQVVRPNMYISELDKIKGFNDAFLLDRFGRLNELALVQTSNMNHAQKMAKHVFINEIIRVVIDTAIFDNPEAFKDVDGSNEMFIKALEMLKGELKLDTGDIVKITEAIDQLRHMANLSANEMSFDDFKRTVVEKVQGKEFAANDKLLFVTEKLGLNVDAFVDRISIYDGSIQDTDKAANMVKSSGQVDKIVIMTARGGRGVDWPTTYNSVHTKVMGALSHFFSKGATLSSGDEVVNIIRDDVISKYQSKKEQLEAKLRELNKKSDVNKFEIEKAESDLKEIDVKIMIAEDIAARTAYELGVETNIVEARNCIRKSLITEDSGRNIAFARESIVLALKGTSYDAEFIKAAVIVMTESDLSPAEVGLEKDGEGYKLATLSDGSRSIISDKQVESRILLLSEKALILSQDDLDKLNSGNIDFTEAQRILETRQVLEGVQPEDRAEMNSDMDGFKAEIIENNKFVDKGETELTKAELNRHILEVKNRGNILYILDYSKEGRAVLDQLVNRVGRFGAKGVVKAFVSFEDEVFKAHGNKIGSDATITKLLSALSSEIGEEIPKDSKLYKKLNSYIESVMNIVDNKGIDARSGDLLGNTFKSIAHDFVRWQGSIKACKTPAQLESDMKVYRRLVVDTILNNSMLMDTEGHINEAMKTQIVQLLKKGLGVDADFIKTILDSKGNRAEKIEKLCVEAEKVFILTNNLLADVALTKDLIVGHLNIDEDKALLLFEELSKSDNKFIDEKGIILKIPDEKDLKNAFENLASRNVGFGDGFNQKKAIEALTNLYDQINKERQLMVRNSAEIICSGDVAASFLLGIKSITDYAERRTTLGDGRTAENVKFTLLVEATAQMVDSYSDKVSFARKSVFSNSIKVDAISINGNIVTVKMSEVTNPMKLRELEQRVANLSDDEKIALGLDKSDDIKIEYDYKWDVDTSSFKVVLEKASKSATFRYVATAIIGQNIDISNLAKEITKLNGENVTNIKSKGYSLSLSKDGSVDVVFKDGTKLAINASDIGHLDRLIGEMDSFRKAYDYMNIADSKIMIIEKALHELLIKPIMVGSTAINSNVDINARFGSKKIVINLDGVDHKVDISLTLISRLDMEIGQKMFIEGRSFFDVLRSPDFEGVISQVIPEGIDRDAFLAKLATEIEPDLHNVKAYQEVVKEIGDINAIPDMSDDGKLKMQTKLVDFIDTHSGNNRYVTADGELTAKGQKHVAEMFYFPDGKFREYSADVKENLTSAIAVVMAVLILKTIKGEPITIDGIAQYALGEMSGTSSMLKMTWAKRIFKLRGDKTFGMPLVMAFGHTMIKESSRAEHNAINMTATMIKESEAKAKQSATFKSYLLKMYTREFPASTNKLAVTNKNGEAVEATFNADEEVQLYISQNQSAFNSQVQQLIKQKKIEGNDDKDDILRKACRDHLKKQLGDNLRFEWYLNHSIYNKYVPKEKDIVAAIASKTNDIYVSYLDMQYASLSIGDKSLSKLIDKDSFMFLIMADDEVLEKQLSQVYSKNPALADMIVDLRGRFANVQQLVSRHISDAQQIKITLEQLIVKIKNTVGNSVLSKDIASLWAKEHMAVNRGCPITVVDSYVEPTKSEVLSYLDSNIEKLSKHVENFKIPKVNIDVAQNNLIAYNFDLFEEYIENARIYVRFRPNVTFDVIKSRGDDNLLHLYTQMQKVNKAKETIELFEKVKDKINLPNSDLSSSLRESFSLLTGNINSNPEYLIREIVRFNMVKEAMDNSSNPTSPIIIFKEEIDEFIFNNREDIETVAKENFGPDYGRGRQVMQGGLGLGFSLGAMQLMKVEALPPRLRFFMAVSFAGLAQLSVDQFFESNYDSEGMTGKGLHFAAENIFSPIAEKFGPLAYILPSYHFDEHVKSLMAKGMNMLSSDPGYDIKKSATGQLVLNVATDVSTAFVDYGFYKFITSGRSKSIASGIKNISSKASGKFRSGFAYKAISPHLSQVNTMISKAGGKYFSGLRKLTSGGVEMIEVKLSQLGMRDLAKLRLRGVKINPKTGTMKIKGDTFGQLMKSKQGAMIATAIASMLMIKAAVQEHGEQDYVEAVSQNFSKGTGEVLAWTALEQVLTKSGVSGSFAVGAGGKALKIGKASVYAALLLEFSKSMYENWPTLNDSTEDSFSQIRAGATIALDTVTGAASAALMMAGGKMMFAGGATISSGVGVVPGGVVFVTGGVVFVVGLAADEIIEWGSEITTITETIDSKNMLSVFSAKGVKLKITDRDRDGSADEMLKNTYQGFKFVKKSLTSKKLIVNLKNIGVKLLSVDSLFDINSQIISSLIKILEQYKRQGVDISSVSIKYKNISTARGFKEIQYEINASDKKGSVSVNLGQLIDTDSKRSMPKDIVADKKIVVKGNVFDKIKLGSSAWKNLMFDVDGGMWTDYSISKTGFQCLSMFYKTGVLSNEAVISGKLSINSSVKKWWMSDGRLVMLIKAIDQGNIEAVNDIIQKNFDDTESAVKLDELLQECFKSYNSNRQNDTLDIENFKLLTLDAEYKVWKEEQGKSKGILKLHDLSSLPNDEQLEFLRYLYDLAELRANHMDIVKEEEAKFIAFGKPRTIGISVGQVKSFSNQVEKDAYLKSEEFKQMVKDYLFSDNFKEKYIEYKFYKMDSQKLLAPKGTSFISSTPDKEKYAIEMVDQLKGSGFSKNVTSEELSTLDINDNKEFNVAVHLSMIGATRLDPRIYSEYMSAGERQKFNQFLNDNDMTRDGADNYKIPALSRHSSGIYYKKMISSNFDQVYRMYLKHSYAQLKENELFDYPSVVDVPRAEQKKFMLYFLMTKYITESRNPSLTADFNKWVIDNNKTITTNRGNIKIEQVAGNSLKNLMSIKDDKIRSSFLNYILENKMYNTDFISGHIGANTFSSLLDSVEQNISLDMIKEDVDFYDLEEAEIFIMQQRIQNGSNITSSDVDKMLRNLVNEISSKGLNKKYADFGVTAMMESRTNLQQKLKVDVVFLDMRILIEANIKKLDLEIKQRTAIKKSFNEALSRLKKSVKVYGSMDVNSSQYKQYKKDLDLFRSVVMTLGRQQITFVKNQKMDKIKLAESLVGLSLISNSVANLDILVSSEIQKYMGDSPLYETGISLMNTIENFGGKYDGGSPADKKQVWIGAIASRISQYGVNIKLMVDMQKFTEQELGVLQSLNVSIEGGSLISIYNSLSDAQLNVLEKAINLISELQQSVVENSTGTLDQRISEATKYSVALTSAEHDANKKAISLLSNDEFRKADKVETKEMQPSYSKKNIEKHLNKLFSLSGYVMQNGTSIRAFVNFDLLAEKKTPLKSSIILQTKTASGEWIENADIDLKKLLKKIKQIESENDE